MYQKRCNGILHEVKKGDTLYTISREHNVPLESVMLANPDVDIYNLQIGSKICVPVKCMMNPMMKPVYPDMPVNRQMPDSQTGMQMDIGTGVSRDMDTGMRADMMNTDTDADRDLESVNAPGDDSTFAYVVRDGDSMEHIMQKFGVSLEDICKYNSDDNILFKPGIAIIIPIREYGTDMDEEM